ncbi:MAG: L,D-transpeptidase, partial [Rhizobium sp.]
MRSTDEKTLSRRAFMLGSISATAALAGCATTAPVPTPTAAPVRTPPVVPVASATESETAPDAELEARYASVTDGGHIIPAV